MLVYLNQLNIEYSKKFYFEISFVKIKEIHYESCQSILFNTQIVFLFDYQIYFYKPFIF